MGELDRFKTYLPEQVAAETLRKSVKTLAKYRREGKLRGIRVGSSVYYDPDELARFIRSFNEVEPVPAAAA